MKIGIKEILRDPLFYYIFLGASLAFGVISFKFALLAFLIMLVVDYFIFDKLPSRINQNQVPQNLGQSLTAAVVAFIIFFGLTFLVTGVFQGTAILQGTLGDGSVIQSIMRHGFAATGLSAEQPIFADSKFLTYYYFGLVIPFVETRFIIRLMEYLSTSFKATLAKFNPIMPYPSAIPWLMIT